MDIVFSKRENISEDKRRPYDQGWELPEQGEDVEGSGEERGEPGAWPA